jgi:8-oxo-dGTP pyrophosphatase MutT (NUDIX family)
MERSEKKAGGLLRMDEILRRFGTLEGDEQPHKSDARCAAVALILHLDVNSRIQLPFIRRAECIGDPWSGHMAFPGGHVEIHDDSLEAAARRETLEEIGLSLEASMCIGQLPRIDGGRLRSQGLTVTPFVYHCPSVKTLNLNAEVAELVWMPLEFLSNPENVEQRPFQIEGSRQMRPCYACDPEVIWGLTYRMIASFMSVFGIVLPVDMDYKP